MACCKRSWEIRAEGGIFQSILGHWEASGKFRAMPGNVQGTEEKRETLRGVGYGEWALFLGCCFFIFVFLDLF